VKNYILDTNVLLHDPNSLINFKDNNVLIPIEVIEEIDRFKRESSELGQNARTVSRTLDTLRSQGHLNEGVRLSNGGCLRIVFHNAKENGFVIFGNKTVDSRIVAMAQAIQKETPKIQTIVVSKDINLRVKANALGLDAEDYGTGSARGQEIFPERVLHPHRRSEPEKDGADEGGRHGAKAFADHGFQGGRLGHPSAQSRAALRFRRIAR
jgi:PhoH-like ATPase